MCKKKVAVMQPYFLPYLEYWRLIYSVDTFIVYDNIQFSKGGWIKKNRFLISGKEHIFSIPISKQSDYLNINERTISENYDVFSNKFLKQVRAEYNKAPYYDDVYPLIENIISFEDRNLFEFLFNSIEKVRDYLGINTLILKSSTIIPNPVNSFQDRLLDTLQLVGADIYINPISGESLYSPSEFKERGIDLQFLEKKNFSYNHFNKEVSDMSILDVMMFISKEKIIDFFLGSND
jgi:hypothetical protein